jgi:hypothetical protein
MANLRPAWARERGGRERKGKNRKLVTCLRASKIYFLLWTSELQAPRPFSIFLSMIVLGIELGPHACEGSTWATSPAPPWPLDSRIYTNTPHPPRVLRLSASNRVAPSDCLSHTASIPGRVLCLQTACHGISQSPQSCEPIPLITPLLCVCVLILWVPQWLCLFVNLIALTDA